MPMAGASRVGPALLIVSQVERGTESARFFGEIDPKLASINHIVLKHLASFYGVFL